MKVGTKSVLFGAHCFFIHPWFVALAWWKLYGFPWDPRLWAAFFVHDLGYWGKPNMDGPEGEEHVWLGAELMHRLFDKWQYTYVPLASIDYDLAALHLINTGWQLCNAPWDDHRNCGAHLRKRETTWRDFCLYHSRFYAKKYNSHFSKLCVADKLSIALEPWWFYLSRVCLSGEIHEYISLAQNRTDAGEPTIGKYASMNVHTLNKRQWFDRVCAYIRSWVEEYKSMDKIDTWTPSPSTALETQETDE